MTLLGAYVFLTGAGVAILAGDWLGFVVLGVTGYLAHRVSVWEES